LIGSSTAQTPNNLPDTASANSNGNPVADVSTTTTLTNGSAGSVVNGTVLFTNVGVSSATGVTYGLTLSPGLSVVTFGNVPAGTVLAYNSATGVVSFSGTPLPTTVSTGQVVSLNGTSPITFNYAQPGTGSSTATSVTSTTTNENGITANNTSTANSTGALVADIRMTKAVTPTTAAVGTNVTFTVTAFNDGPSNATGVEVTDQLPAGYTFVSASPAGAYDAVTGKWIIGAIANGANSVLTITAAVKAAGPYANTATVSKSDQTDPILGNNTATATPTVTPVADVTTNITLPPVNAGAAVNGTVGFTNAGPSTATGVTYGLTLTPGLGTVTIGNLPAGASYTYNTATGIVTFTGMPSSLTAGQIASGNGTSPITVAYTQPGSGISTGTSTIATATSQGANTLQDADTANSNGAAIADLSLTKAVNIATPNVGSNVTFTITVANAGP
jgi:uncharacterized repeat protein (TIGR01451 family)